MNKITLSFDKTVTTLVGFRYGQKVYEKQVKNQLKKDEQNIVMLPQNIEDISSLFVEGMYKKLKIKYGVSEALKIMTLRAEHIETDIKIKEIIETYGLE